ncbi:flagellar protein FlhE [Halomonas sp. LR5S13]|uniref:flagellar protein FlhE n=1 Tax=Halomonas rhizosphaerae TaxID=3043296 RepID=UPI0024A984BB|nr:flagellar protein FlhE [Halomonas rhizosphaerae]MDI5922849.1 flagellar protein FlhE [Halomonas rhizosphaerae]
MTGRETSSDSLGPVGAQASTQAIHSIVWHYRLPPGSKLNARLCHPAGCTPLPTPSGITHALAGLAADVGLEFRFSLPEGQRPVTVSGLQVIVNHQ